MPIMKIILFYIVLFFTLSETALRFTWQSPYVSAYEGAYFHGKNKELTFSNVSKIYGSNDSVTFRTGSFGEIIGPISAEKAINNGSFNIALGGSTTECALVPENKRWPDLLNLATLNFGKSSLNSSHTLENLRYILNTYDLYPKKVFLMDGVNNLTAYLERGTDSLKDPEYTASIYKLALKKSYFMALLWSLIKRSDYLSFYKAEVINHSRYPLITDQEISTFWQSNEIKIKETIKESLEKFSMLSKQKDFEIVVLSQPHFYALRIESEALDLRTTPIIENKRLSFKQASEFMDKYNEITLSTAQQIGLSHFDVSKCLEKTNRSDLFYDAFHYTELGSIYFSRCLNSYLIPNRPVTPLDISL